MRRLVFQIAFMLTMIMSCTEAWSQGGPGSRPAFLTIHSEFQRPLNSEITIVGKVIEVEEKTVESEVARDWKKKFEHKIAVIKVEETLYGEKIPKEIKVAFVEEKEEENPTEGQKGKGKKRPHQPNLTKDQEGCFFLSKHAILDHYTTSSSSPPLSNKDEKYKDQLAEVKKCCAVLQNPVKALKAENIDDRLGAALLLITKYRTPIPGEAAQADISAEETKLIFGALLEGPWENKNTLSGMIPQNVFFTLLPDDAGFTLPLFENDQKKYVADIKESLTKWLKGPGEKYQIKRYVRKSN